MTRALLIGLLGLALLLGNASAASADPALTAKFDAYFASNVFSGAVLVTQHGAIVYDKAFGLADAGRNIPNQKTTSFHVGSLSRLFIAASVMVRVEKQSLWSTNTVAQFDPGVPNGDKITIGDLLSRGDQAAYNLLAHILETNSGKPLADVLDDDFFGPYFMTGSGLDDGSHAGERRMAKGYATGAGGTLTPSMSAPLGSVFTTTRDALRWTEALFGDRLMSSASRQAMNGGGLIQPAQALLGPTAYIMAGQGPGFSPAIVYQQAQDVMVIVLSNRESQPGAMSQIGVYLAALAISDAGGDLPVVEHQ